MMRNLRNSGIGQVLLGTIVVAIILAFVFTGAQQGGETTGDECAVEIGKTCISPKEYRAAFQLLTSVGLNDSAVKRLKLREQVGRGLAEREVLADEATRLGLGTSQEDIDAELLEGRTRVSLPADGAERLALSLAMCVDGPTGCAPGTIGLRAISVKQDGKFDVDLYKRTVRVVTGRSPNHFKEMQQREHTAERLRNLIRSQVRVSEEEAFLAYSRARSKATGRVVQVKSSWFQKYTPAKDDMIAGWAEKNKTTIDEGVKAASEKWKTGCSVVSEIRLDNADPNSEKAAAVKKLADELLTKAKGASDFADLARAESQADSATLGGRVGCLDLSYGAGAATLVEAAGALKTKGALSPVVETIRGFHVLKLVDTVTEENRDALVRDFVTYQLASRALANDSAKKFAEEVIAGVSASRTLEQVTMDLVASTLSGTPFSAEGSRALSAEDAPKVEISRAITVEQSPIDNASTPASATSALFDLKEPDEMAKTPVHTRDGFAVLQLKEKDTVTREKFAEESDDIMASLQQRKAEQALSEYVAALVKKAGAVTLNPKYIPKGDDKENDT